MLVLLSLPPGEVAKILEMMENLFKRIMKNNRKKNWEEATCNMISMSVWDACVGCGYEGNMDDKQSDGTVLKVCRTLSSFLCPRSCTRAVNLGPSLFSVEGWDLIY